MVSAIDDWESLFLVANFVAWARVRCKMEMVHVLCSSSSRLPLSRLRGTLFCLFICFFTISSISILMQRQKTNVKCSRSFFCNSFALTKHYVSSQNEINWWTGSKYCFFHYEESFYDHLQNSIRKKEKLGFILCFWAWLVKVLLASQIPKFLS